MINIDDKIKFKKKIITSGGSLVVSLPKELLEFINAEKDDDIIMIGDESKHGRYIAIFKDK